MDRGTWHGVTRVGHDLATKPPPPEILKSFPGGSVIKNLPANARDVRDSGSIPGSGKSSGEGNGNLLQYSCLEDPMDGGV